MQVLKLAPIAAQKWGQVLMSESFLRETCAGAAPSMTLLIINKSN